jgi:signal peptidase I
VPGAERLGLHWVSDLVLECTVSADQGSGQFLMALVKAGTMFRCEIDLGTGQATLSIDGLPQFHPTARTSCRGPGTHRVRLANVDQRLLLWVDGSLASFDCPTGYWPFDDSRPRLEDLEPARIGSRQAAVRVSHIRLFRDIYYIAQRGASNSPMCDYDTSPGEFPYFYSPDDAEEKIADFFANPGQWDIFKHRRQVEFHLAKDQYLALGDNSAESMDSRLWEQRGPQYYVDRDLLIGKALFIYWPHSWNTIPGTRGWPLFPNGIWFPYFPNFVRMGAVR